MTTTTRPYIRWMIRRDMAEVLEIERQSFAYPWSESEFVDCLRDKANVGMVAEITECRSVAVVGYMIYRLEAAALVLLNFAVDPSYRRMGVGTAMIDKLKGKLSADRRYRIAMHVADGNLDGHLFMRSQGLRATAICRGWYETGDDAYQFEFLLGSEQ